MEPRIDRIKNLMNARGWNNSDLAKHMGVSRSVVTRMLQGQRNGGNKTIEGLYRAFPGETKESLFIFPCAYPNVNSNQHPIDVAEQSIPCNIKIRHRDAHQLACTIQRDINDSKILIKQGKCLTTLHVPPGNIITEYKTE